jgi:sugar phosphate permease
LETTIAPPVRDDAVEGSAARLTAIYRRISWRLLPLLMICYVFAYLDRVNIGFAKLQMAQDIGINDAVYGLGAGIFFLGYVMFEVPSNLLLEKIGARRTITRILVLWGLAAAAMMFVTDARSFYVVRFLLGVFEAGFAPGVLFYLTYWYAPARMAGGMAVFLLAAPIGGIVGGPLSTWIMTAFAGAHGLTGWQWMFLLEGLPCVLLAAVVFFTMDDGPAKAAWLSAEEKELLTEDIARFHRPGSHSFGGVLRDWRVYAMALGYFTFISGIYAVTFWLPTILKQSGVANTMDVGLYSAIPYIAAMLVMILLARSSDRRNERRWHCALPAFVGAIALGVAALTSTQFVLSLVSITIATAAIFGAYAVFWSIPTAYFKGRAAAGGIALINSLGLLGGFLSPTLIGQLKTSTGSLEAGLFAIVAMLIVGGIAIIVNRIPIATKLAPIPVVTP